MWRSLASNMISVLAVLLFLAAGGVLWGQRSYQAAGPLAEPMCVKVDPGSNFGRLSRQLEARGAVSSGAILRLGADYSGKSQELKAGSFLVEPGASMSQIVDAVTKGGASTCGTEVIYRVGVNQLLAQVRELDPGTNQFEEVAEFRIGEEGAPAAYREVRDAADTRYRVAVAEGVTSWQVVNALSTLDLLDGDVADVPPEGALAPDSYEVRPGDTRASVIDRMVSAQSARVAEAWAARDPAVPLATPEELVTLASIIEKETAVAEERRQVSSVFVNRLRDGMRLQTDPTVIYGITEGRGVLGRGLRASELRSRTPWNTYVIDGLPPTPIANPGMASLLAAGQPDETPYLFFVADGTGGHAFAETLAEHNENVARWRRIERQRQADQGN